ncbi:hypothetical protein K1719_004593 [Acacia pycnantha]|nr:hypothetical protein K1719_004593 [Acacia pycnantha]
MMFLTSKEYMRLVMELKPEWLVEIAVHYYQLEDELQNANNTIASIYLEQVSFTDEDYEDGSPKPTRKAPEGFKPSNTTPKNQIKEQLAVGFSVSISVSDMTENIDELVSKVISSETSVSSQDALVTRLRDRNDELQPHIVTLEDDKFGLIDEKTDLTTKLREMDE